LDEVCCILKQDVEIFCNLVCDDVFFHLSLEVGFIIGFYDPFNIAVDWF